MVVYTREFNPNELAQALQGCLGGHVTVFATADFRTARITWNINGRLHTGDISIYRLRTHPEHTLGVFIDKLQHAEEWDAMIQEANELI